MRSNEYEIKSENDTYPFSRPFIFSQDVMLYAPYVYIQSVVMFIEEINLFQMKGEEIKGTSCKWMVDC